MARLSTICIAITLMIAGISAFPDSALAADKLLGSFELEYADAVSPDNALNAALATDMLNGVIIDPGQIFSFNKTVGLRSPEKGFIVALLSTRSKTSAYGYGGGVCMTASILLQAVKAANLPVLERHDHVSDPGYVPLGEDAAISWGVEDFRFKNDLAHPVIIGTNTENEIIRIAIYVRYITPAIFLNDKQILFKDEPFIIDGTTYVPLAETTALLDQAALEGEILCQGIGNAPAARFYEGTEYAPLRSFTAISGKSLLWDGERKEIRIMDPDFSRILSTNA